jgi:hypothetical protein
MVTFRDLATELKTYEMMSDCDAMHRDLSAG